VRDLETMSRAQPHGVIGDGVDTDASVSIELAELFEIAEGGPPSVAVADAVRGRAEIGAGMEVVVDRFREGAACAFLRIAGGGRVTITCAGEHRVEAVAAGGWLLSPAAEAGANYWIPQPPQRRRLGGVGRIVKEASADLTGITAAADGIGIEVATAEGWSLDMTVWRLPAGVTPAELVSLLSVESQPLFLWGSHATYGRPADLYPI